MEIIRVIYGLPQAGILANNLLAHCPVNDGYVWSLILFTLVVDNFLIGYVRREHADHLMSDLKIHYEIITTYWEGLVYCVITMKWNYYKWYVNILMPGYAKDALHPFNHVKPKNRKYQPYPSPERMYGADAQKMKLIYM